VSRMGVGGIGGWERGQEGRGLDLEGGTDVIVGVGVGRGGGGGAWGGGGACSGVVFWARGRVDGGGDAGGGGGGL